MNMVTACVESMRLESIIRIDDEIKNDFVSAIKLQIIRFLPKDSTIWLICLLGYNALVIFYFCMWIYSTNSLVLAAYTNTLFFNFCSLVVCLISIWVEQTNIECIKTEILSGEKLLESEDKCDASHYGNSVAKISFLPSSISVLGVERYEVLCILISSSVTLLMGSFVTVAGIFRTKSQTTLHVDLFYIFVGFSTYFVTVVTYPDAELDNAIRVVLPFSIFRDINPVFGYNVISVAIICLSYFLQHFWKLSLIDIVTAYCLVGLTAAFMLPLTFYTSKIVFHNFTHCMSERLDRCLREALFLDGVMEFRNEKFWTISFGKIAGTLEVRIRKNADEDYVLGNVMRHLSRVITTLTVHKYEENQDAYTRSDYYPVEYFIDEILSKENRAERSHLKKSCSVIKTSEMTNAPIVSIDDVFRSQTTINRKQHGHEKTPKQNPIFYPNNDVKLKKYLYCPNFIRNPLLKNLV